MKQLFLIYICQENYPAQMSYLYKIYKTWHECKKCLSVLMTKQPVVQAHMRMYEKLPSHVCRYRLQDTGENKLSCIQSEQGAPK